MHRILAALLTLLVSAAALATPDQASQTFAELQRMIGGHWIHESTTPDGDLFRVHNIAEHGPGQHSIITRGRLGNAEGMFPHGATQIWREPGAGEVRFQSIDENGAIARGAITLTEDGALHWDWRMTRLDGEPDAYRVTMKFTSDDEYLLNITRLRPDGEDSPMVVDMAIRRVDALPHAFTIVHPSAASH